MSTAHRGSIEQPPSGRPTPSTNPLQAFVPVIVFVVVNRLADLRWAVVAATAWSVWVVFDRRRRGIPLGRFVPIITAAVLVRGVIGIITDSETVYFGLGIAAKFGIAVALGISVLVRRPAATIAARRLLGASDTVTSHPRFVRTMAAITAIAALYYTLSATFDVWLFRRSSVEGYVLIRFLANWPLSAFTVALIAFIAQKNLPSLLGTDSLRLLIEQRLTSTHPPTGTDGRLRGS